MKLLELKNVKKSFESRLVLEDINMEVKKGEIVGLIGRSGSGKSTIFNIISGSLKADSGQVLLEEEDITGIKGKVSYMLQKDLLFPHMNILDNTVLPLIISGRDKSSAKQEALTYFKEFGLERTENQYPKQLSGGMRQRTALLRTYLNKKSLILLDEPFSGLDMITKSEMQDWFLELVSKLNLSAIFISHDIDEAIFLSDRIYILGEDGKISEELIIDRQGKKDEDFKLSREFLDYKRRISKVLKES